MKYGISPMGESAICIYFEERIDPEINDMVLASAAAIARGLGDDIVEIVPTYCTLLVHYEAPYQTYEKMHKEIDAILKNIDGFRKPEGRLIEIPVCYGMEFGEDIKNVASHNKITIEEVIKIHSQAEYRVYMLGFLAGFPYLGGLDSRIFTPRLEKPRTKIEAGSVGIASMQTGIYPVASPGGWQIIGRTPLLMYDPGAAEPTVLRAGDRVRFKAITKEEYYEIAEVQK